MSGDASSFMFALTRIHSPGRNTIMLSAWSGEPNNSMKPIEFIEPWVRTAVA
jgi:hypothetical protein